MHICKVEGTEVLVEWHVGEIIVDVEEKSVGNVGRWLRVRNPVEFVCLFRRVYLPLMISIGWPRHLSLFFKGDSVSARDTEVRLKTGLGD